MKKIMFIILSLFLMTGCVNYTELDELLVVTSIAIDYQNNEYIVYINTVEGSLDDSAIEKKYLTYKSEGFTILEAFNNLYHDISKKVYLSHLDLLVLSEKALTNKLDDIIKTFLYDLDNRSTFNVITTDDIEKLFSLHNFSEEILKFSKINHEELSSIFNINFDALITLTLDNNNIIIPKYNAVDNSFLYNGGLLVDKNKNIEAIDIDNMILYNFFKNNILRTTISNILVLDNHTVLKTNKNTINVSILSNIYKKDEKKYHTELKKKLNTFINYYYKTKKIDILNLENLIYKNDYHYYKEHRESLLDTLDFRIDIRSSLIDSEVNYEK